MHGVQILIAFTASKMLSYTILELKEKDDGKNHTVVNILSASGPQYLKVFIGIFVARLAVYPKKKEADTLTSSAFDIRLHVCLQVLCLGSC